jgi:hypothetical protein
MEMNQKCGRFNQRGNYAVHEDILPVSQIGPNCMYVDGIQTLPKLLIS